MKLSLCGIVLGMAWGSLCCGQATQQGNDHTAATKTAYIITAKDTLLVQAKKPIVTFKVGPPGDLVSGKYDVDANGNLYLPFAGELKAKGLTLLQLRDSIAERLTERLEIHVSPQNLLITKTSR